VESCEFAGFVDEWGCEYCVIYVGEVIMSLDSVQTCKSMSFLFLILSSQWINGCTSKYEVYLEQVRGGKELVLCKDHPNSVDFSDNSQWNLIVRTGKPIDRNQNTIRLDITKEGKKAGNRLLYTYIDSLTEGKSLSFNNKQWTVVKIGHNGSRVNGIDWCSGGFIHIKQI
jgi:hypothetical protein